MIFVCIASGPSLTQEQVNHVKDKACVIVVNDNYKIAPWADHLYAADVEWWKVHLSNINSIFAGKRWIPKDEKFAKANNLTYIECVYKPGLGKNNILHCGHNSGYQAINLAYYLGAKKIILIGYDMKVHSGKIHWFGDHPRGLRNETRYGRWIEHFTKLAQDLDKEGIDVVNCSLTTDLTQFKQNSLFEEL